MSLTIQKLTPALAESFFHFFDNVAFTDNPRWSSCYCYFYSQSWAEGEWETRTAADNRQACSKWMDAEGLNGFLAFLNGEPVGWCHANDKANLSLGYLPEEIAKPDPEHRTASIACFIVSPEHRRQGIATQILHAAFEQLKQDGFTYLEAYPRHEEDGTIQEHYHGHPAMYFEAGFETLHELGDFDVLRKTL
ncbi:GNAT family N-acetyltransferase [Tumebacillus sp. ITR2]|uniref:GNAT family N-acetyltransferase n=1 Tax=Tumebacillus amylolyticus TaxID=2801339 RepID=A0ABS1J675_9BACL|nr:GNAT family N-acetyltransferase [Tumebacillus amylolyticus]MBL0385791.1 GNAT family N-acetyltransferase [Tumebacillus amylolyticus]